MKLSYLQSIDPCDPLPKLGRKVEPAKPESPEAIRLREVEAFERGVFNAVKAAAEHVGRDTFLKAMSSEGAGLIGFDRDKAFPPESVVSFADAAEMADGWISVRAPGRPVAAEVMVRVRLRNGEEDEGTAMSWWWGSTGALSDIIAYRVIKPAAEVEKKKAVTLKAAWDRVINTHGYEAAVQCRNEAVRLHIGHDNWVDINKHPGAEAAAIAALEALR